MYFGRKRVYAYMCTCIGYIHTYIHTYIHMHAHAYLHACMHAASRAGRQADSRANTRAYICSRNEAGKDRAGAS